MRINHFRSIIMCNVLNNLYIIFCEYYITVKILRYKLLYLLNRRFIIIRGTLKYSMNNRETPF